MDSYKFFKLKRKKKILYPEKIYNNENPKKILENAGLSFVKSTVSIQASMTQWQVRRSWNARSEMKLPIKPKEPDRKVESIFLLFVRRAKKGKD